MKFPTRLLVAVTGLLTLAACSDDDTDSRRDALRQNRTLWQSQDLKDYRCVQTKSCFCGPDYTAPTRVDVRDGEPIRAEVISDGRLLPTHLALTVDEAFERIERAIDDDYELLEVTYDPERGFPVHLETDPGGGVQDAGFGIDITDLVPLEPGPDCEPQPTTSCACPAGFPAVRYLYTAWNEAGDVAAGGCAVLTFTVEPNTDPPAYTVSGSRCINVRCRADAGSAHQGTSALGGFLDADGRLSIDLNSGTADNNVYLEATVEDTRGAWITGTWTESRVTGPVAQGRFLLERDLSGD
jgi:hypothetical protein